MTDSEAHSSYAAWLVYHFRAIEKILPALKGKPKWGWLPAFGLCAVLLVAAVGIGIYADGEVIHPPVQFVGHCPSPATIRGGNCIEVVITTATVGSTVTTIRNTQQAGVVENLTSTMTVTVSH